MGSRLAYAIWVPKELEPMRLPPMLIQPLVENAIKHGLEPKLEGGRVDIRAEKNAAAQILKIVVADTGVGIGADSSPGMGSLNINERLEALFGDRGRMTIAENRPAGIQATIEVPYDEP
jgi:sensor histidine kinase YesM